MANNSEILVKEDITSTANNPQLPRSNSRPFKTTKQPEADELLENTILNINIYKGLTKREAEILNLIVAGNTNKEISQKICRTERTIEYHRNRLMHKLGTKTAADLVKRAITMGIA
jgi:DNA-binding NarL/FixJ family response regulator